MEEKEQMITRDGELATMMQHHEDEEAQTSTEKNSGP